jgi:hypothetical protein
VYLLRAASVISQCHSRCAPYEPAGSSPQPPAHSKGRLWDAFLAKDYINALSLAYDRQVLSRCDVAMPMTDAPAFLDQRLVQAEVSAFWLQAHHRYRCLQLLKLWLKTMSSSRWIGIAVCFLIVGFGFDAQAQTGCTPQTQAGNLSALADGQSAGSITPQAIRNLECSHPNITGGDVSATVATAASGTASRTLANRFGTTTDVLDFGAKCDGSTDDTTAIAAAATVAAAGTGGLLKFPGAVCVTGTITIYPNVYYQGEGRDATVVKAKASLNAAVFLGQNFATLTGTNATTGVGGWSIKDMSIDGNASNNSSGDGVQVYGYGFDLQNVSIKNTASDGLYTEWSTNSSCPTNSPPDCMESFFTNLLIHDYHGNGWVYKGPHDSQINRLIIWTFSNPSAKGLYITGTSGANAGLTGTTVHIWGNNQFGMYLDNNAGGINLTNVELEGATAGQLMNGGFNTQIYNLWTYSCTSNAFSASVSTTTTLTLTANATFPLVPGMPVVGGVSAGTRIATLVSGNGQASGSVFTITGNAVATVTAQAMTSQATGLWYGDSANSSTEFNSRIQGYFKGCGINWAYEGGGNVADVTIDSSPLLIGTPNNQVSDYFSNWNISSGVNNVALTSCGTSPSANASQANRGTLTLGTGSPTACTLTVATGNAWPRNPVCQVSANNGTSWGVSAVSTTSVTFTGSATAATLYYQCAP